MARQQARVVAVAPKRSRVAHATPASEIPADILRLLRATQPAQPPGGSPRAKGQARADRGASPRAEYERLVRRAKQEASKAKHDALVAAYLARLREAGLPDPTPEVVFAKPQRWRFDLAWWPEGIAVEFEGGTWAGANSRHTTGDGYANDCRKYSEAAIRDWVVLRFTTDMLRSGEAVDTTLRAWEACHDRRRTTAALADSRELAAPRRA